MKIKFSRLIWSQNVVKGIRIPILDGQGPDREPLSLALVACQALLAEAGSNPKQARQRFKLVERIGLHPNEDVEVDSDDISTIKEAICKRYPLQVAGPAVELLEDPDLNPLGE